MPSAFIAISSIVTFLIIGYAVLVSFKLLLEEYIRIKEMLISACDELRSLNQKLEQARTLANVARDFGGLFRVDEEDEEDEEDDEGEETGEEDEEDEEEDTPLLQIRGQDNPAVSAQTRALDAVNVK